MKIPLVPAYLVGALVFTLVAIIALLDTGELGWSTLPAIVLSLISAFFCWQAAQMVRMLSARGVLIAMGIAAGSSFLAALTTSTTPPYGSVFTSLGALLSMSVLLWLAGGGMTDMSTQRDRLDEIARTRQRYD